MANAGTLSVSIMAKTSKWRKGMRGVFRDLTHLRRRVFSVSSALVGAALGGGLAVYLKQTFENIDATSKFADTVGLTIKQLKGYEIITKRSNGNQEQFNKGVARMQKNIADAEAGLSTSVRTLDKLGLSWEDLKSLSTDEQIKLLAERFAGLNNQVDKTDVLLNMFGRSGLVFGKIFQNGSRDILSAQAEVEKFGISLSRINAAKIEIANDKMDDTRRIMEGIATQAGPKLATILIELSDRFIANATDGTTAGEKVDSAFKKMTKGAAIFADIIDIINIGLKTAHFTVLGLGKGFANLMRMVTFLYPFKRLNIIPGVIDIDMESYKATLEDMVKDFENEKNKIFDEAESKAIKLNLFNRLFNGDDQNNNLNEINEFLNDASKKADALARNSLNIKDGLENDSTESLNSLLNKLNMNDLQSVELMGGFSIKDGILKHATIGSGDTMIKGKGDSQLKEMIEILKSIDEEQKRNSGRNPFSFAS